MAGELKNVQVYALDGRLSKTPFQAQQVSAVEMDGKLFRTSADAHKAKALLALQALMPQRGPMPISGALLQNARAIAAILTTYADATNA